MIVVIFEVKPASGQRDTYLNLVTRLKSLLEQVDGLILVKRFQSIMNPDKVLSSPFFRDGEAVKVWRNLEQHRDVQHVGRDHAFADYRLHTAHMVCDHGMTNRDEAPADSRAERV